MACPVDTTPFVAAAVVAIAVVPVVVVAVAAGLVIRLDTFAGKLVGVVVECNVSFVADDSRC